MKLSELKKGQKLTIRCKHNTLLVDVEAYVSDFRGEIVLLQLIRHEGQVVDFSSPNVQLIAIYEDGLDMPKAWTNCRIQRRTVDGKEYHALAAPKASIRVNRRKVPRVILNLPGKLRVTNVPSGLDIIVHDISVNGVGIQTSTKIEEQEFRHLQVYFLDEAHDDEEVRVEARVIWKKELAEGSYFYGCRLTHAEENLAYYVADKLREEKNADM